MLLEIQSTFSQSNALLLICAKDLSTVISATFAEIQSNYYINFTFQGESSPPPPKSGQVQKMSMI